MIEKLRSFRPDLVGFSVCLLYYYCSVRLADLIKMELPSARVVLGGPHLTVYGRESVSQPSVDFGVVGEGEYTLGELVKALENGGDLASISGLVWKRDGEVVVNEARKFDQPLDDLPMPDFSLLNLGMHRVQFEDLAPTGLLISSRGCPFRCAFCGQNYRYYRMHSAARVVDDMEELQRLGYRSITFFDDNFSLKRKRVMEICRLIKERGLRIAWNLRGRVDEFDEEMARTIAEAGCTRVTFGIESGDQEILDRVCKGITLDQSRSAVRTAKKRHLTTLGLFMVGLPGETLEQAQRTIDFAFELDPDFMVLNALMPEPGSAIYQDAIDQGFEDTWGEFALHPKPDVKIPHWETGMTMRQIFWLMSRAYLRFYLRPRKIFSIMKKGPSFENFTFKAKFALNTLYLILIGPFDYDVKPRK